jgi:hypothetical protein
LRPGLQGLSRNAASSQQELLSLADAHLVKFSGLSFVVSHIVQF